MGGASWAGRRGAEACASELAPLLELHFFLLQPEAVGAQPLLSLFLVVRPLDRRHVDRRCLGLGFGGLDVFGALFLH